MTRSSRASTGGLALMSAYLLSHIAAASAAASGKCVLTYPGTEPILSAKGLATPWETDSNCPQVNFTSFIQGNIIDPATGNLFIYNPLVIDAGNESAIAPTAPTLPSGAIIALHFGTNGLSTTLADTQNGKLLAAANCVNGGGTDKSIFGQYAYCNAVNYFTAVQSNIAKLNPPVPALGVDKAGQACPTTRSFALVDQDPSDNVDTQYLLTNNGLLAQDTDANKAALTKAGKTYTVLDNGSDNFLLYLLNPLIGCKTYMAPDLANNMALTPSLTLDEIHAQQHQAAPVAKVPNTDPMVLLADGKVDTTGAKLVAYRQGVFQSVITATEAGNGSVFCADLGRVAPTYFLNWRPYTKGQTSPNAAVGVDMATFLENRFEMSWANLNCKALINISSPVVCVDAKGQAATTTPAVSCTINTTVTFPNIVSDPVDSQPDPGTPAASKSGSSARTSPSIAVVLLLGSLLAFGLEFRPL